MDPFQGSGFPKDPMVPIGLPKGRGFTPIGSDDLNPFGSRQGGGGMLMGREQFQNKMPGFNPYGTGDDFGMDTELMRPGRDPMGLIDPMRDLRNPAVPGMGAPFGEMARRDGLIDPSYSDPRFMQDDRATEEMLKTFEKRRQQKQDSDVEEPEGSEKPKKPVGDAFVAPHSVPKGAKFDPIAPQGFTGPGFGPGGDLIRFGDEAPPPGYNDMYM